MAHEQNRTKTAVTNRCAFKRWIKRDSCCFNGYIVLLRTVRIWIRQSVRKRKKSNQTQRRKPQYFAVRPIKHAEWFYHFPLHPKQQSGRTIIEMYWVAKSPNPHEKKHYARPCVKIMLSFFTSAFQSLQDLSNDPVIILLPHGLLNAMAYTTLRCPSSVSSSSPVDVFHTYRCPEGGGGGDLATSPHPSIVKGSFTSRTVSPLGKYGLEKLPE